MKKLSQIITESDFEKTFNEERKQLGHLNTTLTKHYSKFDVEHETAIKDYTSSHESNPKASKPINNYLWNQHQGNYAKGYTNIDYERPIKHLDSALQQHKTPHKLTVYSGVQYDPRKKMGADKIVHHPAYLSGSLNKQTALDFGKGEYKAEIPGSNIKHHIKQVLNIHVPKGHPGAYVEPYTSTRDEHEFILPRGMNLKYSHTIRHHIDKEHKTFSGGNYYIDEHHMTPC